MINRPSDYATAAATMGGDYEKIPVGGHVCVIRSARCDKASNGKDMLVLAIEIAEGTSLDGFYKRTFERIKGFNSEARWPGIYNSVIANDDGTTNPMFKGLMVAIEESNPGYKWDWCETSLAGKKIGFNFGEEEYVNRNGEVRTNIKPRFPASVKSVHEGLIPLRLKKLQPTRVGGSSFTPQPPSEDLPF